MAKKENKKNIPKTKTREILDELMNSDGYKRQEALLKERKKTIKHGTNVIHLENIGELNKNELEELRIGLRERNLELSTYDKSGILFACLDDYTLTSFLSISPVIVHELFSGVGTNAIWDAIKWSALKIWNKVKVRKMNKLQSGKVIEKDISFGLVVRLNENTSINMKLQGDVDEKIISESLDKALGFLKEQSLNSSYKISDYAHYSSKTKKWVKVDVLKEIQKMANKKKPKKRLPKNKK